jgi:hypothetical protein
MLRDHRGVFARCIFKPLPLFDDYPRTAAGEQRYKTEYALRRFQIDDATREAVKCSCCSFVGLRKGVFSTAASDLFPPLYRQTKFVYRRLVEPPAGSSPFYYVYLFRRQARANDVEVRGSVCSSCIAPMRGGNHSFNIEFFFPFALMRFIQPSFHKNQPLLLASTSFLSSPSFQSPLVSVLVSPCPTY